MSIAKSLLAEFEIQAPITRKFLERLPEDKLTWKPHEKSMSAGQLAYHLAFVPGGVIRLVNANPTPEPSFNFPSPASRDEVLKTFAESITTVRECLSKADDASLNETWRLSIGGPPALAPHPRHVLRRVILTHSIHHLGPPQVYLCNLHSPLAPSAS